MKRGRMNQFILGPEGLLILGALCTVIGTVWNIKNQRAGRQKMQEAIETASSKVDTTNNILLTKGSYIELLVVPRNPKQAELTLISSGDHSIDILSMTIINLNHWDQLRKKTLLHHRKLIS